MPQENNDIYFLRKTFDLAKKAQGDVSPNPMVGAIIVKGSKVIASGYHRRAGLPHAEIEAINKAKGNTYGAALYVNLEPCCHYGRTPPCVDAIVKSGIKKVVISHLDPNPRVYGKSVKIMRRAGIYVKTGLLKKEARKLNEVFFKNMEESMPFVTVKIAQSIDGKITTRSGQSKWITQKRSRNFARGLRDLYDAVVVGINTVVKDDPSLSGKRKNLYRIVFDPSLKIPLNSRLIRDFRDKLIVFSFSKDKEKIARLSKRSTIFILKEKSRFFNLKTVLKILYHYGIMSVYVEGGSFTIGSFLNSRLIDKAYFFIAPLIIGGDTALTSVGGRGFSKIIQCPKLQDVSIQMIGKDLLVYGYPYYGERRFI